MNQNLLTNDKSQQKMGDKRQTQKEQANKSKTNKRKKKRTIEK